MNIVLKDYVTFQKAKVVESVFDPQHYVIKGSLELQANDLESMIKTLRWYLSLWKVYYTNSPVRTFPTRLIQKVMPRLFASFA